MIIPWSTKLCLIPFGFECLSLCIEKEQDFIMMNYTKLIYDAIKYDAKAFQYLRILISNQHLHQFCILNPNVIRYLPISYHNDIKFMMDKIKNQPHTISFASEKCSIEILSQLYKKNNMKLFNRLIPHIISKEIILKLDILSRSPEIYDILPLEFKTDIDILLHIFPYRVDVYMLLPEMIRYDKINILSAIKRNPLLYVDLPCEFRYDREITLCAVSNRGSLLTNTSDVLQEDDEVVYTAIKSCSYIINSASLKYRLNIETLIYASSLGGTVVLLPELNLNKQQVIRLLETRNYDLFFEIPIEFRDDRDITKILLTFKMISMPLFIHYEQILKTDRELLELFITIHITQDDIQQFINLRYETDDEWILLQNYLY
jgi:hypothetical protein